MDAIDGSSPRQAQRMTGEIRATMFVCIWRNPEPWHNPLPSSEFNSKVQTATSHQHTPHPPTHHLVSGSVVPVLLMSDACLFQQPTAFHRKYICRDAYRRVAQSSSRCLSPAKILSTSPSSLSRPSVMKVSGVPLRSLFGINTASFSQKWLRT